MPTTPTTPTRRHFWLRDSHMRPVACIATEHQVQGNHNAIVFSVATWNPLDTFNRARGRTIAYARLIAPTGMVEVLPNTSVKASILRQITTQMDVVHQPSIIDGRPIYKSIRVPRYAQRTRAAAHFQLRFMAFKAKVLATTPPLALPKGPALSINEGLNPRMPTQL